MMARNSSGMKKNKIIVIVIILIISLAVFEVFRFLTTTQSISIKYDNVIDIKIYKAEVFENKQTTPFKDIMSNNSSVRLKKGDYYITWKASDGYKDGNKKISLTNRSQSINIDPGYSDQKLSLILDKEINNINKIINDKFPETASIYIVGRGELLDNGNWYLTTLQYNGSSRYSSDTLKIILKKEGNSWVVMTTPPSIVFNKKDFKNIPDNILSYANLYLYTPIQQKYLSE